jgi:hypothetical protein
MSAWRFTLRTLGQLGGSATTAQIADVTIDSPKSALHQLMRLGMVEHDPAPKGVAVVWRLTPKGQAWCQGRLTVVPMRERDAGKAKQRFAATWLMSYPGVM